MGLKITGLGALNQLMNNTAERSSRGARESMKRGAEKIAERSKEYAPVDEGNLEKAIESVQVADEGFAGRIAFEVRVNETFHAVKNHARVKDYAIVMHEDPNYQLGPKSRDKDGGSGKVGPKFMERAFVELSEEIKADVAANINKGIGH